MIEGEKTKKSKSTSKKNVKVEKPDVFSFTDYREYIKEIIKYRRAKLKSYTIKDFAQAIGFSSHAGLAMILTGKRQLKSPYIEKSIKNLKLSVRERVYFEALIRAGELTPPKRQKLLREVKLLSSNWKPPHLDEGFRILDLCLIHQILCLNGFSMNLNEIYAQYRFPINMEELARALEKLVEQGFVGIDGQGRFRIKDKVMVVEDEKISKAGQMFHLEAMNLASIALEEEPLDKREFQTYFMTFDSRKIGKFKSRIKEMVLEVIKEFEEDLDADNIIQLHFHMFQLLKDSDQINHEGIDGDLDQ